MERLKRSSTSANSGGMGLRRLVFCEVSKVVEQLSVHDGRRGRRGFCLRHAAVQVGAHLLEGNHVVGLEHEGHAATLGAQVEAHLPDRRSGVLLSVQKLQREGCVVGYAFDGAAEIIDGFDLALGGQGRIEAFLRELLHVLFLRSVVDKLPKIARELRGLEAEASAVQGQVDLEPNRAGDRGARALRLGRGGEGFAHAFAIASNARASSTNSAVVRRTTSWWSFTATTSISVSTLAPHTLMTSVCLALT